jgi:hypothetical protein
MGCVQERGLAHSDNRCIEETVAAGIKLSGVPGRLFDRLRAACLRGDVVRRKYQRLKTGRLSHVEALEQRQMYSVATIRFSGSTVVVTADALATSVAVSAAESSVRIQEVGTDRLWSYPAAKVGSVEFRGGAGNDRFINNIADLPIVALGGGGNDYLKGYDAADELFGGDGNDVLLGAGGDDLLSGDAGNDNVKGGAGNDVLLGGAGRDQLLGEAGDDRLNGQASVDRLVGGDGNDVVISIDAAFNEYVDGGAGADIFWADQVGASKDRIVGIASDDIIQSVSSFANGADRSLDGDRIKDPATIGKTYRAFDGRPLFAAAGPTMSDINQGVLGDCYLLAGLAAIARDDPHALRQYVVDFDDGTYGVRLGDNFYRVDNDLPVNSPSSNRPAYAALGAQQSMWVAIVEKAFAHYRRDDDSYASLEGGWAIEVNRAFGAASAGERRLNTYSSAAAMANSVAALAAAGQAVTIGFIGAPVGGVPLVTNHMYAIASIARNTTGAVTAITLFNPWGIDGAGSNDSDPSDGLVTLTPAQIFAQYGRINWGRV